MNTLKKLAEAKRIADQNYKHGFEEYFAGLALLTDERFFEIAKLYAQEVYTFCFQLARTNGVKQAAWELFRKALCKEKGYSGVEMTRFAKTYEAMKERLYQPLFDLVKDKGDDSYGDLLDNLPLLGAKLFKSLEDKEFGNPSLVRRKIEEASGRTLAISDGQAMKFVWEGENYHAMSLREAAEKYCYLSKTDD
jgi:hypothetical protein